MEYDFTSKHERRLERSVWHKILSVTLSGVTAWLCQAASNSVVKVIAGALALVSSISALIMGVTLSG